MKHIFRPLVLLIIPVLLSACTQTSSTPSESLRMAPSSLTLDSVTAGSIEIKAERAWTLSVDEDWLSVEPSEGTGSATVIVRVDPSALAPGSYYASIKAVGIEASDAISVHFLFPRIAGDIVKEEADASNIESQSLERLPATPGKLLVGLVNPRDSARTNGEAFREFAQNVSNENANLLLQATHPHAHIAVYEAANRRASGIALANDPRVRYVEIDHEIDVLVSNDTYRSRQWSLDTLRVDEAWPISTGSGVTLAVIDTGFHPDHPDLAANIVYQYDFGDDSTTVAASNPGCGTHGNHVAGIAGAITDNEKGVASVAPKASLILLDVDESALDNCPIYLSSVVAALDWVAAGSGGQTADVVNISLGTASDSSSLRDAIRAVYQAGVTIVAAAGNDPTGSVLYPAAYSEVIAVSATGPDDRIASYSTTGQQVWVSAPGGDMNGSGKTEDSILSTVYRYSNSTYGYAYSDGTSMSSPAVAAVAALILSTNPDLGPDDVAHVLAQSSDDLGGAGWDEIFGHGRVNARRAVELATTYTPSSPEVLYILKSSDGQTLEVQKDGTFDLGYVAAGELTLEAGSDDNENGILNESGEYYGTLTIQVDFGSPQPPVELIVEKQP